MAKSPLRFRDSPSRSINGRASSRREQWQLYADKVTAFARYTLSHGVRLCHHHMGAYVEAADDIDQLMALTGPEVGLLFDSGHITFAGWRYCCQVLARHIDRVSHTYTAKDVRPAVLRLARNGHWSFLESVMNGVFTMPGDGCVDFKALLQLLHAHGYEGWLVVEAEQDPAVAPSYQYAEMGYRYLSTLVHALEGNEMKAVA